MRISRIVGQPEVGNSGPLGIITATSPRWNFRSISLRRQHPRNNPPDDLRLMLTGRVFQRIRPSNALNPAILISHRSFACEPIITTRQSPRPRRPFESWSWQSSSARTMTRKKSLGRREVVTLFRGGANLSIGGRLCRRIWGVSSFEQSNSGREISVERIGNSILCSVTLVVCVA